MSFVGSGYLIGITLIGYYLTAYDPQKASAGQGAGLEHLAPFGPNPIDVKFLGWVRGGAGSIMNCLPDRAKAVFRRDQTELERAFHQVYQAGSEERLSTMALTWPAILDQGHRQHL